MDAVLCILIVLEMIFVNVFVVGKCMTRKYSLFLNVCVFIIFTAVTVAIAYPLLKISPNFGNGNGLFVLVGFFYLIPMKMMYKERVSLIMSVLCTSWIYTMLLFCISVHLSKYFTVDYFLPCVLIVQSMLYILTGHFFVFSVKNKFLFVLKNISEESKNLLQFTSLCWFGTIILINLSFVYYEVFILRVLSLTALFVNALLSYITIYQLIKNFTSIKELKHIIYTDNLTGALSRASLFNDTEKLIHKNIPFTLLFIDLDKFKSINDRFGHLTGDMYLCFFVDAVNRKLDENGKLYRMSGDEFICIYTGGDLSEFQKNINELENTKVADGLNFSGCSMGCSRYPDDSSSLDKLIFIADNDMYKNKKIKFRYKKI